MPLWLKLGPGYPRHRAIRSAARASAIVPALRVVVHGRLPYARYTMSPWVQLCAAKRSAATLSGRDAFVGSREG